MNEKLREGYEHAPERESAAILRGRTSYRIKLGKTGEDTFGGIPKGVTAKSWPLCAECKNPTVHIMMLHAHPERMPLSRYEALALFVCRNEEGACSTFDPDSGCSATLFLTNAQLERSPLEKPPTSEDGAAPAKALRARRISYREVFETDPENEDNAEDIESTSKVGGYPGWIQFAQDLECDTCKKEMVFVAEIGELDEALNFAGGDGYLFRCPDEHQAKFFWQH